MKKKKKSFVTLLIQQIMDITVYGQPVNIDVQNPSHKTHIDDFFL